ncbi:Hsp33 protein [Desulfofarcimen acetoxidans DSM 771]|uniref:33 kDa chaperonin n=1 Tax=Desulfofarcimen acetoxidans (strain ATCC 49208 / DSM 771 / KCTC 5769 / VKM B-1644 / 5575) TaxID=485916 RepID=C8W6G1_DESAS|nr:Hsp33 family molecular chaperone HslO [Desulfofarcimen acetoxidans]ACV62250.1 Hsp33 protein [Desulfofarcimen acetoxidans DSM 771]
MQDYLIRAVGKKGQFRVIAAVTTGLVEEARRRHSTWPVASAALGRTLTAGLLLGANLKGDDLLTVRVRGDGPLGAIIVSANGHGDVRGYVQNPQIHVPGIRPGKLGVGNAVGKGTLSVSKDLGLREPFTGSVELVSGEIGEDIAYYLLASEQTPSAVSLGVLVETDNSVRAAGGLIVQLLPGAEENMLAELEDCLNRLPPISSLVNEGKIPEEIVKLALGNLDIDIIDNTPVRFYCSCTRERIERMLAGLGEQELRDIYETTGQVEVICHFCGEKYNIQEQELGKLLQDIKKE